MIGAGMVTLNWSKVRLDYALVLGDRIAAETHPGMDGSINPFVDEYVTETNPVGHRFQLSYFPITFGNPKLNVSLGAEFFGGFTPARAPRIHGEPDDGARPDWLAHGGGGVGAIGHYAILGKHLGIDFGATIGGKRFDGSGYDLGARGFDRSLHMSAFYFAPMLAITSWGAHIGYRAEISPGVYREFPGMTDADNREYRFGIGAIGSEAHVSHLVLFGIDFDQLFE